MIDRWLGGSLEGEEPTPEEQERYWQLAAMEAALMSIKNEMNAAWEQVIGTGVNEAFYSVVDTALRASIAAYDLAKREMDLFLAEHIDTCFALFRPETIADAFESERDNGS